MLCGGRSSRFGSDKSLASFGSTTVGGRVIEALRDAGVDPVVAIGGTAGRSLGLPTVADLRPDDGPLAGLATALLWAKSGHVIVAPCDLPLLEAAHVRALIDGGTEPTRPTVATVGGDPAPSLALWPASHGRRLLRLLDAGERRLRAALHEEAWTGVELPAQALADADTPEDLERLRRYDEK